MKKILCFILCFVILSCNIVAIAETTPTIALVCGDSVNSGETFDLYVTVTENSNICGGRITLGYDNAALEIVSITTEALLSEASPQKNPAYTESSARVSWASLTGITSGGNLLKVTFKAKTTYQDTAASVFIQEMKFIGSDDNIISCNQENSPASINVKATSTPPAEEEDEGSFTPVGGGGGGFSSGSTSNKKEEETEPEVEVEVETEEPATAIVFSDVKESDWFYESVKYVTNNKLMNGVSETDFAPNNTLTRAMLVTVLYRNEGSISIEGENSFVDVKEGSYYSDAVIWAKQNGIVNGVTETAFAPDTNITREQIAAIMYRYATYKGYDVSAGENTNILSYDDFNRITEYAIAPLQYAAGSGLMKGKTATTLNPGDNATRAEIAAILQRFIESNKA